MWGELVKNNLQFNKIALQLKNKITGGHMKDHELLMLLERHGKYSIEDLSTILNEDVNDVEAKITQFEKDKVICGYHTLINWDKTNVEKVMAIIYVDAIPKRDTGYDEIAKRIYRHEEVETMYLMSGKSDFTIIIHGKTMKEVANFVATKLACIEQITATTTLFVLQTYKYNGVIMNEDEKADERLLITP